MNYGAYGSYPRRRTFRRRLGAGSSIVSGYRKKRRVNPVNQYTYRKTRIGKYTMTGLQQSICTAYNIVGIQPSGSAYTYAGTSSGNSYWSLASILTNSPEFITRSNQFSYYMIRGMQIKFSRRWMDPISYGVNGESGGFLQTGYAVGLSALWVNFFPNLASTNVGQPTQDADSSFSVNPFLTTTQTHYQPFPKNFTTGPNSNGLGVWNACSQYMNISGEISLYSLLTASVSDGDIFFIWDMEVNVYMSFCNNTGS